MSGKAARIMVTEKQQGILQQIANAATATVAHVLRAKIILEAMQGNLNRDIATTVGLDRKPVGLWRRRWAQSFEALVAIECRETNATLYRAIQQVLSDAQRIGAPCTFTAEQVTQILAVACEPPKNSGRPVNHWTHRELTDDPDPPVQRRRRQRDRGECAGPLALPVRPGEAPAEIKQKGTGRCPFHFCRFLAVDRSRENFRGGQGRARRITSPSAVPSSRPASCNRCTALPWGALPDA